MHKLYKVGLIAFVVVICHSAMAQLAPGQIYLPDVAPPTVFANGKMQPMAWAGGFNNPQFAMGDLNNDGIKDLVVYDRVGRYGSIKTFLNESVVAGNPKYVYHPEFEVNFPYVADYMKLEDYNRDGIADLFHKGMGGVSVHTGYYNTQKQLCFKFFRELRYLLPGSGLVNAYVAPIDIPAIIDIDKDDDLDVVSYDIAGSRLVLYRNCEKEDGLTKDSFRICLKDECWGRTLQLYERTMYLGQGCGQWGTTCKTSSGAEEKTTHAGNTVCLLDYDGDGDLDMFNGNVSFSDIQYIKNGKKEFSKTIDSFVSQDTTWGNNNGKQLYMPMMPMTFWLDIDNDGNKDLVFSPRLENTENHKCVAYYRNLGTNAAPNFSYISDTLFIQDMIDVGAGAQPVLYDYNKDGKLDLFVGSEGYYQANGTLRARINYYENTSTATTESFELKDADFLGLNANNSVGITLAFGDIDGDGLDDLIIGKGDGTVMYYRNSATSNTVKPIYSIALLLNDQKGTMDVGDYSAPFVYDINKDGKKDLIVGSQMGNVYYYRNLGGVGTPTFLKLSDSLHIVDDGNLYGYTVPFVGKLDNTNKDFLLIGSKSGILYRYDSLQTGNASKYVRVDSNYSAINVHDRAAPFVADLDNDGKYDMLVGSTAGGIVMYKQYFNSGVENTMFAQSDVKVYPNPAKNTITLTWKNGYADNGLEISMVSVTGQKVKAVSVNNGAESTQIDISDLAQGMYYCIVRSGNNQTVVPVSIIK